jgi:hypothetical protein
MAALIMVTTTAISSNMLDWTPQSDLQYYEDMKPDRSVDYSVVPAYLNAALSKKEYLSMLEKIKNLTRDAAKWVLLQEINIESRYYCAYFLTFGKKESENVRVKACLEGLVVTYNQTKYSSSKDINLEQLVYKDYFSEKVNISNYKKDGTMLYLTVSNENNLQRVAVYNLERGYVKDDFIEMVLMLKSIAKGLSTNSPRSLDKRNAIQGS